MTSLTGVWKLIKTRAVDNAGNELPPPLGPEPMGVILYEAERMMVVVCDGRQIIPPGAGERAFISYAGAYRLHGDELVTRVDGASSPDGFADQVRQIRFEGPNRYVASPRPGVELTWERVA